MNEQERLRIDSDSIQMGIPPADTRPRLFVFQEVTGNDCITMSIPETQIRHVEKIDDYLVKVNGSIVRGSFDRLINMLGRRVDF